MKLDDLGWSTIVNELQNDAKLGADLLVDIAIEKEKVDKEYLDAEIRLGQLKTRQLQLRKGSLNVLKHLKKETPLAVVRKDFIVVVSDKDITIERNTI